MKDVRGFCFAVAATAELEQCVGQHRWTRLAPIAGRVHHDPIGAEMFEDVDPALRRDFRHGIDRQATPEAVFFGEADRVFFAVIDQHSLWPNAAVVEQDVDDDRRAFVLVVQMRRVDQDHLIVRRGDLDLFLEMLYAPLFQRWLHRSGPLTPAYADALVEATLRAFGTG